MTAAGAVKIAGTATDPKAVRPAYAGAIIDADVHAVVPSLDVLRPFLAAQWNEFIDERGVGEPFGLSVTYPPGAETTVRADWRLGEGAPAASSVELLRRDVLDPLDVEAAIVTCNYAVDSVRHPDFAAALAAAVNDWLAAEWLDADPRLRASLVVPARQPEQMTAEIRRLADDRRFVQVMLPVRSDRPYGNRIWHPVLAEIAAQELVLGLHLGGSSDGPPSPTGWPSWYVEEYAAEPQVYMAQLTSLIGEGAFQAVPDLKVAIGDVGFAWLPSLMWRLDKEWKGLRRDVPWVDRPPSELVREHVRLTVAPLDAGPLDEMAEIIGWLGSDDLLMFATDYPHGHEMPVAGLLERLPQALRARLMAGTARSLYGLTGGGGR